MIGGTAIKGLLGPEWTTWARTVIRGLGRPKWGNLRRVTPISANYGFDRGTPIDRYYVDRFFTAHRNAISGRALEIQTTDHITRYGAGVTTADTLDINPACHPTYCCDLAHSDVVPSGSYDCFLLPNTLCFLRDLEGALREARRIVRPGGAILATVPVFVPLTPDVKDYWHASADGWRIVVDRVWPDCDTTVESHGNCLAAAAAMYGVAVEELSARELDVHDPRYPVLVTISCRTRAS
jgi:SAM-dependent methyltransferase